MKLLFLQETDWLKRNPAQQHHLAEMMSLRGHEICAIDHEISWKKVCKKSFFSQRKIFNNISKINKEASITVIRPGFLRFPILDYISLIFSHKGEIDRQISEFQPDAIIGFGILNSYLAIIATKGTKIPFIYYWIDVLHLLIPTKSFSNLGKYVERASLKRADRILTINERLKDLVVGMGAPKQRTSVLRAGIYIKQFDPSIDSNILRKQYGFNEQDIVLFFMGFLYNFAGLKEVAMKLAQSENNHLKFLIVGEGDAFEEIEKIRDKYNLKERMILAGKKSYQEIPGLIASADICILPSYSWEPIMQDIVPIKLYEYMAMGKPVIATRLPGVVREFGEGNGMVYVEKPDDVIDKAIELVSKTSLSDLGIKARRFAERNSWDKITDEFESILREAMKAKQNVG